MAQLILKSYKADHLYSLDSSECEWLQPLNYCNSTLNTSGIVADSFGQFRKKTQGVNFPGEWMGEKEGSSKTQW